MYQSTNVYVNGQLKPMLTWQQVLEIIHQTDVKGVPVPFSVTYCTYDQQKGTGGEIITCERAVWALPGGRLPPASRIISQPSAVPKGKNPNHVEHGTINIRSIDTDQVRKVHLNLILTINGQHAR